MKDSKMYWDWKMQGKWRRQSVLHPIKKLEPKPAPLLRIIDSFWRNK